MWPNPANADLKMGITVAQVAETQGYQSLLLAKALPDPDFRYRSKSAALNSFVNAIVCDKLPGLIPGRVGDRPYGFEAGLSGPRLSPHIFAWDRECSESGKHISWNSQRLTG